MIVVIQCAARKAPDAGCFLDEQGRRVLFVADPSAVPDGDTDTVYARSDDVSPSGASWRALVSDYNRSGENPFGLKRAAELYQHPVYRRLEDRFGSANLYILSAGWGLIPANFLTPLYDITFSAQAERWKRRRSRDRYADFALLRKDASGPVIFFGGNDYLPQFGQLTSGIDARRYYFTRSARTVQPPGCTPLSFETTTRTNWHYQCAAAVLDGVQSLPDAK